MEPHRKYTPHLEYGVIVWYKTTKSESFSVNMKTGNEQRTGTGVDRVVTSTSDYGEACKQLDRRLTRVKKDTKEERAKPGPNQLPMFDEETS